MWIYTATLTGTCTIYIDPDSMDHWMPLCPLYWQWNWGPSVKLMYLSSYKLFRNGSQGSLPWASQVDLTFLQKNVAIEKSSTWFRINSYTSLPPCTSCSYFTREREKKKKHGEKEEFDVFLSSGPLIQSVFKLFMCDACFDLIHEWLLKLLMQVLLFLLLLF